MFLADNQTTDLRNAKHKHELWHSNLSTASTITKVKYIEVSVCDPCPYQNWLTLGYISHIYQRNALQNVTTVTFCPQKVTSDLTRILRPQEL
jgi:hypothetical protein